MAGIIKSKSFARSDAAAGSRTPVSRVLPVLTGGDNVRYTTATGCDYAVLCPCLGGSTYFQQPDWNLMMAHYGEQGLLPPLHA
jgi:hypothetical protein